MDATPQLLVAAERPAAGEPDGAIVVLHGRGGSERDTLPLLAELDPERRLAAFAPRAPLALPPGGAHWYAVRNVGFPDPETFAASLARASAWLDALAARVGVPIERTVLAGFSQGAAMSYALGLGRGRPTPAGILALSGFIPVVDGFDVDLDARAGLPVAIAHGSLDRVLPVELGRTARDRLAAAGLEVSYREPAIGHGIEPALAGELRAWLRAAIERAAARRGTQRATR